MIKTAVCVLRSGGIYDASHVARLQETVEPQVDRFVCLTDMEVDCDCIPMITDWPSWWAKLELFHHFSGQTLYLDLDNIVVGDLRPLFRQQYGLTMVQDFIKPNFKNSSVMSWLGDHSAIADTFASDPRRFMAEYKLTVDRRIGDQAFIEDHHQGIDCFGPSDVLSYKKHCAYGVPKGARVVQFHGQPKYTEVKADWIPT